MHKLFTSEDVISFAYNEMPADEAAEFCLELTGCSEIASELDEVLEGQHALNCVSFLPQSGVVQAILNYSKSLKIQESPSLGGPLEMVLN